MLKKAKAEAIRRAEVAENEVRRLKKELQTILSMKQVPQMLEKRGPICAQDLLPNEMFKESGFCWRWFNSIEDKKYYRVITIEDFSITRNRPQPKVLAEFLRP